ncbi:uncharacterized protein KY384_003590 [Bacidia gigantensis]|uniref:uncharacterized protein n=1 Tax=Bacidia gigantensis TaxID=2732470 RepID=UPI001D047988|nr:uncharacterized protein KY384_003590 [Bacidia gigantensis]KAG8531954.1 hypothetical protein KY384_003590 [Bacidia gigantensis]
MHARSWQFLGCRRYVYAGIAGTNVYPSRCSTIYRGNQIIDFIGNTRRGSPIAKFDDCTHVRRGYHTLSSSGSTIYALSTAPGRAAIAIIRVSGPACLSVYHALCPNKPLPRPRYAALRTLCSPFHSTSKGEVLDAGALVLYFPAPETVTGEDLLEFHVHGGTATVKAILEAIPKTRSVSQDVKQDIRYADPGEFTKRAFYNDRLDLTQVEALGDTLSAETEQQRRLAVRGSKSILAGRYDAWRQKLLYARGELEALIDFSEDQHFEESSATLYASVAKQVRDLQEELHVSIENACRGELLRNGINIALVGAPNAGKSSLLNRIVGREAAIVSDQAGTTRDIVDVNLDIGGYLCRFGDLAGLREKSPGDTGGLNSIEEEGIRRARDRALKADVVIVFLSVAADRSPTSSDARLPDVSLGAGVEATLNRLDPASQRVICVLNKADLFRNMADINQMCLRFSEHPALHQWLEASGVPILAISCKDSDTGSVQDSKPFGVASLLDHLTRMFGSLTEAVAPSPLAGIPNTSAWSEALGATERQRVLLQQCLLDLDDFLAVVNSCTEPGNGDVGSKDDDIDIVLAAEHLRSAASCLAKITGRGEMSGDVEEVLGVVFEKFCVGK